MRCGRTFRLARTHPAHARLSGSETLLRRRSLADCTINMHESEFSEATGQTAQSHIAHLRRLYAHSDEADRRPQGRPQCCCLWKVAVQHEAVDSPCRARDAFSHHDDIENSSTARGVSDA